MSVRNNDSGFATRSFGQRAALPASPNLLRNLTPGMAVEGVMALDFTVIVLCAIFAHLTYNGIVYDLSFDFIQNLSLGALLGVVTVFSLARSKSYEIEHLLDFSGQIGRVLSTWTVSVLVLVALAFMLKISTEFSRGWVIVTFFVGPVGLLAERAIVAGVLSRWLNRGRIHRNVAIVGAGPLSQRLCDYIRERGPKSGIRIIGIFDDRRTRLQDHVAGITLAGTIQDLFTYARNYRLDEVIVALPWSAEARVVSLVEQLSNLPADIRLCPDFVGLRYFDRPYSRIGEIAVLHVNGTRIKEWALIAKTVQDYVIATLSLILLAPLFGFIALAIKMDGHGPILFKQQRRGFNQNRFSVWKFRTMTVLEDGAQVRQCVRNDGRVTRLGRFLRRTSLDELPQLINVLQGHMSIVGPRPHALAHDDYYETLLARYPSRQRVKPGITGWAQVNGYRGNTAALEDMAKRVEYDIYYIENWSLRFDIKILILTALKGFWHSNAY